MSIMPKRMKMKQPNSSIEKLTAIVYGIALSSTVAVGTVAADDTEVFFGQASTASETRPNVLFVLDTSSSMNRTDGGST